MIFTTIKEAEQRAESAVADDQMQYALYWQMAALTKAMQAVSWQLKIANEQGVGGERLGYKD